MDPLTASILAAAAASENAELRQIARRLRAALTSDPAGEPVESFLPLLSHAWRLGWQRHGGTAAGFLRNVDWVLERLVAAGRQAIAEGSPAPYIGWEIQCVLWHADLVDPAEPTQYQRAWLLVAVALHLPAAESPDALQRALQSTLAVAGESSRTFLLRTLAPHLPEPVYQAALDLDDEGKRAEVLVALSPHLPKAVYQAALDLADENRRAWVLRELAPYLPKAVYQAALDLRDEAERAHVLSVVAPHLAAAERAGALRQALRSALAATEEGRSWLLSIVAPSLPEAERAAPLQEALRSVLTLAEEAARLGRLYELTPTLVALPAAALYDCWAAALPRLKEQPYSAVLGIMPLLVPVIAALGGDAALSQTLWAVEEVGRWWPPAGAGEV